MVPKENRSSLTGLRAIAYAFLFSASFQLVWWGYFLYFNHERLFNLLSELFSVWWLSKLIGVAICVYLLVFAWITFKTLRIGITSWRLSRHANVKLLQTTKQKRDTWFAFGYIVATLIVTVFMPVLRSSDGVMVYFAAHLSSAILFGCNLLAIALYEGEQR